MKAPLATFERNNFNVESCYLGERLQCTLPHKVYHIPFNLMAIIIIDHMYSHSPINTLVIFQSHAVTRSPTKLPGADVGTGVLAAQVNGKDCSHYHCIATHDYAINSIIYGLIVDVLGRVDLATGGSTEGTTLFFFFVGLIKQGVGRQKNSLGRILSERLLTGVSDAAKSCLLAART